MSKDVDPKKVATFCQQILNKYISTPVNIKPESENPKEPRYSIQANTQFDNTSIATTDRGAKQLRVFPFKSSDKNINGQFWIYFSITYDVKDSSKKYTFYFNGVSICIFRGLKTDISKEMLFRAEWDCKSDEDNKIHPHPHWHIHFVKEKMSNRENDDFEDFMKIEDNQRTDFLNNEQKLKELREFDITKFHFAMGASWHPKRNDKLQLDEVSLKSWLNYTLEHIKEQLDYAAV